MRDVPAHESHEFDGVGVCIFCNSCDEPTHCSRAAEPCNRSVLTRFSKSADEIRTTFRERDR